MSPPEEKPPQRASSSRSATSSATPGTKDTSSGSGAQGRTLGGNVKMRFTPRAVPRRSGEGTPPAPAAPQTSGSLLGERSSNASGRGRGRGRGRNETPVSTISGPFAAGPVGIERRSTRQMRAAQGDTSVTVESVPAVSAAPAQPDQPTPSTEAPSTAVKVEGGSKPGTPIKAPASAARTRIKREDDDVYDEPEGDETMVDGRVDLAELNFPGGPVSSRRKNERGDRGWKKIELWIEQEEAEEIVISDDEAPAPSATQPVRVKVEDEPMSGVVMPEPETMIIDDDDQDAKEDKMKRAKESRARKQKRRLKGKTREEKEEMAREEIDTEILKDQFLGSDAAEREQKLFLLQLPLMLPPLRNIADVTVKSEVKTENPTAPPPTAVVGPPPSGKVGQLKVHASGKMVLSYGGIDFPIRLASDVGFAQDFVVINPEEAGGGKAWRLGSVGAGREGSWLVGVPDLKGMHKSR